MKSGKRKFLEPSGPLQACNGTDLRVTLHDRRGERSMLLLLELYGILKKKNSEPDPK